MSIIQLGIKSKIPEKYSSEILFSIKRKNSDIYGYDIWNLYEFFWINQYGYPEVRIGKIKYSAKSEFIIESKSMKLYLFSISKTRFSSEADVISIVKADISKRVGCEVDFTLYKLEDKNNHSNISNNEDYQCIDSAFLNSKREIRKSNCNSNQIIYGKEKVFGKIYTNSFVSNCPVTNQPDFASIFCRYEGNEIDKLSFLDYISKYRESNEFHEDCICKIYSDLYKSNNFKSLLVFGMFTRRGGIDICPIRSSEYIHFSDVDKFLKRQIRQ